MESETVYTPTSHNFPFSDLTLANPQGLQGGAYFSKLKLFDEKIPIQMPKCLTKNGIHKTEKKIYCDLMFDSENDTIIEWVNNLETKIKHLIFEKRDIWFNSEMDMDTIEYHWQPILRTYKNHNRLLRCFIKKPKMSLASSQTVQVYDEEENLLQLDDVEKNKLVIAILEISGLKFTTHSFSIEFHLKQLMILKNRPMLNRCLIKMKKPNTMKSSPPDEPLKNAENLEENISNKTDEEKENLETAEEKPPNTKLYLEVTDAESDSLDISSNIALSPLVDNSLNIMDVSSNIQDTSISKHFDDLLNPVANNLEEKVKTEELIINQEPLDKNNGLDEINLVISEDSDIMQLKKPNEVYLEIYKEARRIAKEAKKKAILAYLEAKRIKSNYLLDEIESSDEDSDFLGVSDDN